MRELPRNPRPELGALLGRLSRAARHASPLRLGRRAGRRLAQDPGRLRLVLGLAAALAVVLALEASPPWGSLRGGLAGLDFDPSRADLIAAWLASALFAGIAGALTGRPWASALAAAAFLVGSHAAPWAWHAALSRPVVFGAAERLSVVALAGQLCAIVGVGLVAAVPLAAGGDLVGTAAVAAASSLRQRRPRARTALLAVLVLAGVAAAVGAAPLLRYGPARGLYLPAVGGRTAVPAGQVLSSTFRSAAMGAERPFAVYLPPGYDPRAGRRYPVVYLLHGDPGGYQDWANLGIGRLLDAGIASGSLPPLIAVMPDGNGQVNHASQWADAWDGRDRVEDSVLELVALVDRQYRTVPSRRQRVIAGLSEGGFGAANLAARHPGLFGIAISLSGYFTAQGPVFGANPAYQRANSPSQVLSAPGPARSVYYLLAAGQEDARYRHATTAFAAELDRLGVRHQLFILPGGHDGGVWTAGLVTSLELVRPQLQGGAWRQGLPAAAPRGGGPPSEQGGSWRQGLPAAGLRGGGPPSEQGGSR